MSRREQIKMSAAEVAAFLDEERTVTCATLGPRGWPHLMPLWYVVREAASAAQLGGEGSAQPGDGDDGRRAGEAISHSGPRVWAWTYGASQKVRNIERSPRATLQVEAGEQYQELRGVMFECDVVVHRDLDTVQALGEEIFKRQLAIDGIANWPASPRGAPPASELAPEVAAMVRAQAAKRVALEFVERRRATWDHRKLGGVY